MYPRDLDYVKESIYREPYRFYIPWFGLAPTIQVNGFYFGSDKLSHFASTGMIYFKTYFRERNKGKTDAASTKAAIEWGIRDEKSVHGYWASGVFSYADLEANYQGFRFYRNFCEGKNPYLKRDRNWILVRTPRIADYVDGHWDETFELSYRLPKNWEKVAEVLREEYCELRKSDRVQKRFTHYRKSDNDSFSRRYLQEKRRRGTIPLPQSFEKLCSQH